MYKQSLLVALYSDYEDAAKKYMDARNESAHDAECYLHRMKVIGRDIDITIRMMDGTMGKQPLERDASHPANQALAAILPGMAARSV